MVRKPSRRSEPIANLTTGTLRSAPETKTLFVTLVKAQITVYASILIVSLSAAQSRVCEHAVKILCACLHVCCVFAAVVVAIQVFMARYTNTSKTATGGRLSQWVRLKWRTLDPATTQVLELGLRRTVTHSVHLGLGQSSWSQGPLGRTPNKKPAHGGTAWSGRKQNKNQIWLETTED